MNLAISEEFGLYFARIPLVSTPHIYHGREKGNALRIGWSDVLPAQRCAYILGNPPFVGSKLLDDAQRKEMQAVFADVPKSGTLDFVAAWYKRAADYMRGTSIRTAFVSTNSICQGEQPGILWGWLLGQGVHITFAHRTFRWDNEGRGVSAVHCVIVGFSFVKPTRRIIYEYDDVRGEPHATSVGNINPYLVDAPDVALPSRSRPICAVPEIGIGNKPIDDGNYLFSAAERDAFVAQEPAAARHFRRWLGADEFINGYERWCLWLRDVTPDELRRMPHVLQRIDAVRIFWMASKSKPTKKLAQLPTRFHVESIARERTLVIPRHSSERRAFVPIGYYGTDVLVGDACLCVHNASLFDFGVLTSTMHNAWIRYTCGRLESRYRYSKDIVYNNFPWPETTTEAQRRRIEAAAQGVLDARSAHPGASLADLYDPLTMPVDLVKAHQALRCRGGRGLRRWDRPQGLQERRGARGLPLRAASAVHKSPADGIEAQAQARSTGRETCRPLSRLGYSLKGEIRPSRWMENSAGRLAPAAVLRIRASTRSRISAVAPAVRLPLVNTKITAFDARIAASSLGLRRMFWSRVMPIQPSRPTAAIHSSSRLSCANRCLCAT